MDQPQASKQRKHSPPIHDFLGWMRDSILYAVSPITDVCNEEDGARCSFVPIGEAKKYLEANNHLALDDILDELFGPEEPPVDSVTVLSNYVAVFCILLDMGEGTAIADFVHYDHNDQQLPFDQEPPGLPPDTGEDFFTKFRDKQWRFCVPTFQKNMARHFKEERILPISLKEKLADGGSSTIHKIKLHGDYNKLLAGLSTADPTDPLLNTFALKTYLSPEAARYYECEVSAFRGLNRHSNPHLIGFYGNYRQGSTYNIILEYADEGSLEQYFEKTDPPCQEQDIINFWTSLFGIFKALSSIHKTSRNTTADVKILNGWHQDVKPANILVVSNRASSPYEYQFKLADLGLSHFKMTVEGTDPGLAVDAYGTQTYGAPECFRDDKFWDDSPLDVKQDVDIWSLGCVLSEACVWMCQGYSGILSYRQDRTESTESISKRLGDCFHDGRKVLPVVHSWHESIPKNLRHCDHITPRVLRIIKEDMLQEPDYRLNPKQLWGKAKALIDELTAATSTVRMVSQPPITAQAYPAKASRDLQDSPPSQWPSLSPQHSPPTPTPTSRNGPFPTQRFSNSTRVQPIFSTYPVATEPDNMSTFEGSTYDGGSHAIPGMNRTASTGRNRRPMSQPQSSIDRPRPRFSSDNHINTPKEVRISEESPFDDDESRPNHWASEFKGKASMRQVREIPQPSYTDPSNSIKYPTRTRNEDDGEATLYRQGDEDRGHKNLMRGLSTSFAADSSKSRQKRWDGQNIAHMARLGTDAAFPRHSQPLLTEPPSQEPPKPVTIHDSRQTGPSSRPKASPSKGHSTSTNGPWLPLSTALEWRRAKKENSRLFNKFKKRPVPKLPGEFLLGKVMTRDHVFIIDDSDSMRVHWDEMCELFSILAYIVKRSDDDGIDMYFTMTPTQHNSRNVSELVETVKRRKAELEGTSNINDRLDQVLMEYDRGLKEQINLRKSRSPYAPAQDKKPLTVYVFTDGKWGKRSDPRPAIKNLVSSLVALGYPASQVGIQFISFGRDPDALKRFALYDSGLGLDMDIVDHTPSSYGNLWKMILGATDRDYDSDSDDEATQGYKDGRFSSKSSL